MEYIYINFSNITTKEELHELLRSKLDFPDYYGNNLDSLMDCLTDISYPVDITLSACKAVRDNLPDGYGDKLIRVFNHAVEENHNLIVHYI